MDSDSTVDRLLEELRSLYGDAVKGHPQVLLYAVSPADLQRLFAASIQASRIASQEARLVMLDGDRNAVLVTLQKMEALVGPFLEGIANSLLHKSFNKQVKQSGLFSSEANSASPPTEALSDPSVNPNTTTLLPIGQPLPSTAPLTFESLLDDNLYMTIELDIQASPSHGASHPSEGSPNRRPSASLPNGPSLPTAALILLAEAHFARYLIDSTLRDLFVLMSKRVGVSDDDCVNYLNRASHFGAKTIFESDLIHRCFQRLESISNVLMIVDGKAVDVGGCWGEIATEFQTSVPVAKAQMSQCVVKSRLGRHKDATRHATISVMLIRHVLNTPGGHDSFISGTEGGQHPRALLVAALYNLGSEQKKCGDAESAKRSFDEAYEIASTPIARVQGGAVESSPASPPLLPSDPLFTALKSLASPQALAAASIVGPRPPSSGMPSSSRRSVSKSGFTRERHHSLIHTAGMPPLLPPKGSGDSPKRASTAGGIATTTITNDATAARKIAGVNPPTIGGEEYSKIPFVAVSMGGRGTFIGYNDNKGPNQRGTIGNLFAPRSATTTTAESNIPRLVPIVPTVPKDDVNKPSSAGGMEGRRSSRVQGDSVRAASSSRNTRLPSISARPKLHTEATEKKVALGGVLTERSTGLRSLVASLMSDLQQKLSSQYDERSKSARRIQCAWRCSRARLESFNRRQIFLHSLHVTQKGAVTCLVSNLKCLLARQHFLGTSKNALLKVASAVAEDRTRRRAALRILSCMRAFSYRRREKARLLRVLQLSHESKLVQYAAAALIIQRWWPLIKVDKAYWRRRNAEIEAEREKKRLRELSDKAATSIQRVWRGVAGRKFAEAYKLRRYQEKAHLLERIKESIDCIRIVLKEMAAKKRRLQRAEAAKTAAAAPDTHEAEIASRMIREAQRLFHTNMIRMSRACKSIQRAFRAFLARRQLRVTRTIARTHEHIRIDTEFDQFKAARRIQCAIRQQQARKIYRRERAYRGRHIIECIWNLQRVGRGFLARFRVKQSSEIASALVEMTLKCVFGQITKNSRVLEACVLWKNSQYVRRDKVIAAHRRKCELLDEARRELMQDVAASRIQRLARSHQARAATRVKASAHIELKRAVLVKIIRLQSFARMVIQKARFATLCETNAKKRTLQRLYIEASDARIDKLRQALEDDEQTLRSSLSLTEALQFVRLLEGKDENEDLDAHNSYTDDDLYD